METFTISVFMLTDFVSFCLAGVAAARSHSVNHGGAVAEDRGGKCGEDDAVRALHDGVRRLSHHQGESTRGPAWPA